MKKVVLMSLDTAVLELSPAKYQLLEELYRIGFETYVLLPGRLKNRQSYSYINYTVNVAGRSYGDIRKVIRNIAPQIVIATLYVDTAVIYTLPFFMKKTSFYYYNLEIYTPYLNKDIKKEDLGYYVKYKMKYPVMKIKEMIYTKMSEAFTIQDTLRMKVSRKYHIRHPNTLLIPNSYIFDETKIIDTNRRGLIYTGGINRYFLLGQFENLKSVKNIPVVLMGQIDQWCKQKMKGLKTTNPNIKFEEQVLSIEEYTQYLQQFAVGLVWYSPLKEDETHYYIGLSSGKMFKHLSLGQPVIAIKCPGVTEIVNKYNLGVGVDDISEIENAYNKIMGNYTFYRENVLRVYRYKFDFKKIITPFLECLEKGSEN